MPYELKPHGTIKEAEDYFAGVVDQWNSYVIAHDGDLPADPYRFMSGPDGRYVVESYEFARHLPPRVNPALKQNPRYPVFWTTYYLDEVWTCYADGTWDRLPMSEAGRRLVHATPESRLSGRPVEDRQRRGKMVSRKQIAAVLGRRH